MSDDSSKVGAAPGGPGSIAAANAVPGAGTRGIASGGLGNNDPAGSSLAGKSAPIVPGGTTAAAASQPGTPDSTGMSGGATNDAMPHGGSGGDSPPLPNARPGTV